MQKEKPETSEIDVVKEKPVENTDRSQEPNVTNVAPESTSINKDTNDIKDVEPVA